MMTSVTTIKIFSKYIHFEDDKSHFKGHMIKRILHKWSFHIKFITLALGSFYKFHMMALV